MLKKFKHLLDPVEKWKEEHCCLRQLISLIIDDALKAGADRVAFISPPEDSCERVASISHLEAKPSIDGDSILPKHISVAVEKLMGPIPIFNRSENARLPLWFRISGVWHLQAEGPAFVLLHEMIEVLEAMLIYDTEFNAVMNRRILNLTNGAKKVYVELWFEENFTYALTISEVHLGNTENRRI